MRYFIAYKRKRLIVCSSLLFFTFLQGCGGESETKIEQIRPVKSILVVESSGDESRTLPGKVQSADKVDLSFQVSGPLVDLPIKRGQEIEKGQVLAKIDPRDFKSKLKAAEAQYKRAKADVERVRPLVKRNLVSKAEVGRFEAVYDVAGADLEQARKAFSDTSIVAPFSGAVADIFVENFQDVQAKEKILSLQNNRDLEIIVQVPEKEIVSKGKNNFDIQVYFEAVPGRNFEATIKEFSTEADPDTQTYEVILGIDSPEDINLLPGMSASVVATKRSAENDKKSLYVPVTAVFNDPGGKKEQYVWLVNEAYTVSKQQVTVSALANGQIEIASGVKVGQRIVVAGVHYLVEGQQVKLIKE
jgi:RND family efflux transporter MFP subunit